MYNGSLFGYTSAAICALLVALGLVVYDPWSKEEATAVSVLSSFEIAEIPNAYDDGESAYIKVDKPTHRKSDGGIAELMAKKKAWQQLFPNKRIVAMTYVTGFGVVGLLIHYEVRE